MLDCFHFRKYLMLSKYALRVALLCQKWHIVQRKLAVIEESSLKKVLLTKCALLVNELNDFTEAIILQ